MEKARREHLKGKIRDLRNLNKNQSNFRFFMYRIKTTPTFDKDIKKLDRQIAKRIIQSIQRVCKNTESGIGEFIFGQITKRKKLFFMEQNIEEQLIKNLRNNFEATTSNFATVTLIFNWDFGNGNSTTTKIASISHIYNATGTFTLTLTVSGGDQTASTSTKVIINSPEATSQ